jgi:hypothetical protein
MTDEERDPIGAHILQFARKDANAELPLGTQANRHKGWRVFFRSVLTANLRDLRHSDEAIQLAVRALNELGQHEAAEQLQRNTTVNEQRRDEIGKTLRTLDLIRFDHNPNDAQQLLDIWGPLDDD